MRPLLIWLVCAMPAGTFAMSLDDVISRNTQALGGEKALAALPSWQVETSMENPSAPSERSQVTVRALWLRDGGFFTERSFDGQWQRMGYVDTQQCWIRGADDVSAVDCMGQSGTPLVFMRLFSSGFSLKWLRPLCQQQFKLVDAGKEGPWEILCDIDSTLSLRVGVDRSTWLVQTTSLKETRTGRTESGNYTFVDYQREGALLWPHKTVMTEGKDGSVAFTSKLLKLQFDVPIDRRRFEKPSSTEP